MRLRRRTRQRRLVARALGYHEERAVGAGLTEWSGWLAQRQRRARLVSELRGRSVERSRTAVLAAFSANAPKQQRKRCRLQRGLKLWRSGLLAWGWAWLAQNRTRRKRRAANLAHAKVRTESIAAPTVPTCCRRHALLLTPKGW